MPTIDFIFFDAGGGHRAAANALKSVVEQQRRPWTVRLVNLQEVLDPLDIFRKITGLRLQDIYNRLLAKGWTLGSTQLLPLMHGVIRVYHGSTVKLLEQHWRSTRPDMVVSLVPNFNRAMRESLAAALPDVRYVTVLTDFADYPPHFWIEKQDQYFICGTERAFEQARSMGHAVERLFRVSGMILRPKFYEPVDVDRASERRRLGLDPDRPTGLVLFGGEGSAAMLDIASRLNSSKLETQLILICGRNEKLAARLRGMPKQMPMFVEGFTPEIPYYMAVSDYFIGKPGPGSISEAVHMNLPVIVERNSWTLPQERYNAEWVVERGAGMALSSFKGIAGAVRALLEPANLSKYRASVGAIENRAVFEIADILEQLLQSK